MIRRYFLALSLATAASISTGRADVPEDHLRVGELLNFEGSDYALAWSAPSQSGYFKQEYLPAGQSLESWTDMVIIEALVGEISPDQAAGAQARRLNDLVGQDPFVQMEMTRIATDEYVVDFVLSDLQRTPPVVEWNVYRYAPIPGGQPGVALFGAAQRGYGDEIPALLEARESTRASRIATISSMTFPTMRLGTGSQTPRVK